MAARRPAFAHRQAWRCKLLACLAICTNLTTSAASAASAAENEGAAAATRQAFFGDLHVHTKNSLDSFMFSVSASPDDAYRFARGEAITHTLGYPIQLQSGPLDFAAVTDHGELLGVLPAMADPENSLWDAPLAGALRGTDRSARIAAFVQLTTQSKLPDFPLAPEFDTVISSAWQETFEAAERYNEPGLFTTFVGYEYSSAPDNQNLHRNVIFRSSAIPAMPFSANDSDAPEDLWHWMDKMRNQGIDSLSIPHNSNVSNGLMFDQTDRAGRPLTAAYAETRMRNEPLVEIIQVKGTSETHPDLSPGDEWATFELYDTLIASDVVAKKPGGFVRDAYLRGLQFQDKSGFNPYRFGVVGSTDTHNAGSPVEEPNFFGKVGALDGTAELRRSVPGAGAGRFGNADAATTFAQWGAAGLAGIWAEENTRESLFAAMRRGETFATSGPRIRVRFFAGYGFDDDIFDNPDLIRQAYERGVPMGAELVATGDQPPRFIVWAVQDPDSTRLQRLQIVKGWVSDGRVYEQVFDVACSDGGTPDPGNHRCPDSAADVNLENCAPTPGKGSAELMTLWRDPLFDSSQHSFYYVRVLENPSCRWTSWDALRAGTTARSDVEPTIQERAWSSPIWFMPE